MHGMTVSVRLITAETHSPGLDMEMWEAWYCQDGVTVFFGTNKENQDVLMVSEIVHAPPNLVTEVRPHIKMRGQLGGSAVNAC